MTQQVCLTERGVTKRNQNDVLIKQPEAVKIPVSNSPSKNPKSAPISKALIKSKNQEELFEKSKLLSMNFNMKLPKISPNIDQKATAQLEEKLSPRRSNVNDTLEEEICEEIQSSPQQKECDLFDPFSGKIQVRKKVLYTIDKELESSGSIFTGRDELSVIKLKRKRDAEIYSKILKEQIEEKKIKINLNKEEFRSAPKEIITKSITKINKGNNLDVQDQSPAVISSRYSNSNTACTRNLFTPSEDNCLSQHLNEISLRKQQSSNFENQPTDGSSRLKENANSLYFSSVNEEECNENNSDDDNLFSFQTTEKKPFVSKRMSDSNLLTQNTNESSIILLEGAIESLLKEQQQLKSKLFSQEKVISLLVREQTQDASSSNMISTSLKPRKRSSEKSKIKMNIETDLKMLHKQSEDILHNKSNSSSRLNKRDIRNKIIDKNVCMFNKHRGSCEEIKEPHFLEKVDLQSQIKSKPQSKSLGRNKEKHENKVKILEPQYESSMRENPAQVKEKPKYVIHDINNKYKMKAKKSRISETDLSKFANLYITADNTNHNLMGLRTSRQSMMDSNIDLKEILASSTKGLNLPLISTKNSADPVSFVKGTSYDTKALSKNKLRVSNSDTINNNDCSSVQNELDMISTILLPPEDTIYESFMKENMKTNPYFILGQNKDIYIQDSMINNYDQMMKNLKYPSNLCINQSLKSKCRNNNDFLDLLSSQYSSRGSSVAPEGSIRVSPGLKSMSSINKEFIIKHANHKRGKDGRSAFPSDFFETK